MEKRGEVKDKIMVIAPSIPYPPRYGLKIAIYQFIEALSKIFEIHLVVISSENIEESFVKWAKSRGITYKFFKKSKIKSYVNVLRGLIFNNYPLQVNYFYFKDVQEYIDRILMKENFHAVIPITVRTVLYTLRDSIHDFIKLKFLFMIDSIAQNYKRSKEKTRSLFWKVIYAFEGPRLQFFEERCVEWFDKTIFVNKEEALLFNNSEKTYHLPNHVDECLFSYNRYDAKYKDWVVFFGRMKYQPNIDAVLWFVSNVLPKLDRNIKFAIIGSDPSRKVVQLFKKYDNVIVTGFVDDPYVILRSALCVVAPMQTGAGIQNKVLEAMAVGAVVIVSSLTAKPIGAENMKDFIVEDDPVKIAELIGKIYKHPEKFNPIRLNARNFIRRHFSRENYEIKLSKLFGKTTIR